MHVLNELKPNHLPYKFGVAGDEIDLVKLKNCNQ